MGSPTSINRWLVALACAWINLFIFAAFRSGGVLYLSIVGTFECTYQQAAWSVSIAGSVASITGIAAGFFTHYIAIESLVIGGVFCCALSLILTFFAHSIQIVMLTVGLVQGIGIGFVTNLLPAILSAHFVEKKAIALGISYAGATLGAFIFPVFIQSLITEYGFHGTMLIVGGLTLNGIAGGLLLHMPKSSNTPQTKIKTQQKLIEQRNQQQSQKQQQEQQQQQPQQQQFQLQPLITECDTIVYVDNNNLYQNITDCQNDAQLNANGPDNASKTRKTANQSDSRWSDRVWHHLRRDMALLLKFHFVICTFTYIGFILDFVTFIIILPDVAKAQGIADSDSRWLLSIFSITDFLGRIVPGWFSYWDLVTDKSVYVLSITVMGLCMLALILAQTWTHFVAVSLVCGFVTGAQMVLSPAMLADYLGTENTAITFGMANFICGLFTLVTRPMIIGVKDIYGNYDLLGYLLSSVALFSGLLWIIEILFTSIKLRRNLDQSSSQRT